jgi:hypothetical protein
VACGRRGPAPSPGGLFASDGSRRRHCDSTSARACASVEVPDAHYLLWNVITVSLRQRITPDRLLGRVNSAYRLLAWGTMPLGAAAGGLLAQWLGLQIMFGLMGVLSLALLAILPLLTDKAITAADVES